MCGRITLTNPADIFERFDLAGTDVDQIDPSGHEQQLLMPRYNIAPSQTLATVVATPRGRVLQPMKWGYQPAWLKSAPKQPPPINARAE
ncbi:MAG: SOS response-associated peptidase family protein, partial [Chloroflexi bacterium]|nr:SOS response-associated peptidase family protein [Chloroflexota bacterium]